MYGIVRVGFPCGLGLANSCSTAVDTKPFSTSVIQELVRIFATTTKICAGGGSMPACAKHFCAHHRTLLLARVSSQGWSGPRCALPLAAINQHLSWYLRCVVYLGAVTLRLVHPTAPVLLTKTWPTRHTDI
uniref:Uncharacterized protein n=1 Tax=Anopheles stephensi TaxID=30069 RepID=A0A182YTC5_ANOST